MLEKELRANWDAVFYPEPEPEAETFGEEVQPVEPPVLLASGPSGTVSDAGAAFGVFPQMKPRRAGRSDIGANLPVLAADVVAGAGKGAISGVAGLPGDLLALGRGLYEIGRRGGDEGKLDAFLRGMEAGTIVPTSDDVDKWLTKNIGPVVPSGVEMESARTKAASAGRLAGELVADPVAAVKGAKAVVNIAKSLTAKGAKLTPTVEVPAAGDITRPAFKKWFGNSRVANDNGQPIVVYHARSGDFGEFDTSGRGKTKGTGAFFSSSADVASTYAIGKNENIVPVYLSMKSPVVIDVNGAHWSNVDMSAKVSLPEIKVSDVESQRVMAELTGEAIDESATRTLPAAEIALGELRINNKIIDKKVNTDDIARWARKQGYDGVIIKNVIDTGPSGRYMPDAAIEPNDVYIAFNPEQIKSVFNKGTWNPNDPRLLYGSGGAAATGTSAQDGEQK